MAYWIVNVNNGQHRCIVEAATAANACLTATDAWHDGATQRQLQAGIYDIRASRAKLGEVNGPVLRSEVGG